MGARQYTKNKNCLVNMKYRKVKKLAKNDDFLTKIIRYWKFINNFCTTIYEKKNITKIQKKYPSTTYVNSNLTTFLER